HVGVMNPDLQHHAPGHARGGISPRFQIDLAETVAADVGLGVHELAELTRVDFLPDPAEMALAAALVTQREHHAGLAARRGDRPPMPMQATRRGSIYFELAPMDSTASRAMRSSVAQSPPLTPTPPMHSPSTITGQPPSIAVQRPGPAASASPRAWATSSACPC